MDYDWTALALELGLDLVLTLFVCFLIPVIILVTGKKYKAKTIKRIAIINCILCWLLFQIIQIAAGFEPSTGLAAFFWGGIGYTILKKRCLKEPSEEKSTTPSDGIETAAQDAMRSLSGGDKTPRTYGSYNVPATELRLETAQETIPHPDNLSSIEDNSPQIERATEKTARYCSKCGSIIDSKTKKCSGCGNQYFKGIPWKPIINVVVVCLLVVSAIFNGVLYTKNTKFAREIKELKDDNETISASHDSLNEKYSELKDKYAKIHGKGVTDQYNSQYALAKMVAPNAEKFCEYIADLKNIATNGTYKDIKKEDKVVEYINDLSLDYGQKIILYRIMFFDDSTYNNDIVDYLNERDDITYSEMEYILEKLGFAVLDDGSVEW